MHIKYANIPDWKKDPPCNHDENSNDAPTIEGDCATAAYSNNLDATKYQDIIILKCKWKFKFFFTKIFLQKILRK